MAPFEVKQITKLKVTDRHFEGMRNGYQRGDKRMGIILLRTLREKHCRFLSSNAFKKRYNTRRAYLKCSHTHKHWLKSILTLGIGIYFRMIFTKPTDSQPASQHHHPNCYSLVDPGIVETHRTSKQQYMVRVEVDEPGGANGRDDQSNNQ